MSYKIRIAGEHDIERLLELRLSLLHEVGEIHTESDIEKVKIANKNYLYTALNKGEFVSFVAESEEQIIAISGIVLFKRPPHLKSLSGVEAYVMNMFTIPEKRGKGIGGELLDHCLQYCKNNDVGRVFLHASQVGRSLYIKKGFIDKKSEMELILY